MLRKVTKLSQASPNKPYPLYHHLVVPLVAGLWTNSIKFLNVWYHKVPWVMSLFAGIHTEKVSNIVSSYKEIGFRILHNTMKWMNHPVPILEEEPSSTEKKSSSSSSRSNSSTNGFWWARFKFDEKSKELRFLWSGWLRGGCGTGQGSRRSWCSNPAKNLSLWNLWTWPG